MNQITNKSMNQITNKSMNQITNKSMDQITNKSELEKMIMDVTEIQKYLPHRYPFLLVDRVIEFEAHKRIVAIKNVTVNEPMFNGHFPDNPVFPGIYIVEALAQASGILAFKSRNRTLDDGFIYYLAGTDKTKFKRSVVPGDQLRLEVEIINLRNHWMKSSGKAYVGDDLVCSSLLTCAEQQVS